MATRFGMLVHALESIVWEADPTGNQFRFVSQFAETLLGYPLSDWAQPGFWASHLHPDDRTWVVDFCSQSTARKENHSFTYRFLHQDGHAVWLRDMVTITQDENGVVTGLQGVMFDITAQKEAERALQQRERQLQVALADAQSAEQAKSMLLANMSHEFRTPLNAILGFSEMMAREMFGPLGDKHYREYAGHILDCGRHLLNLVNDVLDLSRIEAGKYEIQPETIETLGFLAALGPFVEQQARSKGLALVMEAPGDIPLVRTDRKALLQILLNLLSNAIKFTENGEVRFGAKHRDDEVEFFVADTGPGIPARDLARIMMPFEQVQTGYAKSQAGTGLGLSIAKRLADLSGGKLTIQSELGQGTRVSLALPAAKI